MVSAQRTTSTRLLSAVFPALDLRTGACLLGANPLPTPWQFGVQCRIRYLQRDCRYSVPTYNRGAYDFYCFQHFCRFSSRHRERVYFRQPHINLADRVGFELTGLLHPPVFKTGALNHSATYPNLLGRTSLARMSSGIPRLRPISRYPDQKIRRPEPWIS